jgi:membrane protein implicated in regulation of membrane protease activity
MLRWSRRRRAVTGPEALIGRTARVITTCRPAGQVRVAGELWRARSASGADPGDEVVVRDRDGLTLLVD